ncbi:MAG: class I SAM-dependent methyltransferase, partial [bacterium]
RFDAERPAFRTIVERYGIKSAVDAGCGTGFHSLLLAQLGVDVTATDVSPIMLGNVSRHSNQRNLNVKTVASDFQTLAHTLGKSYDAVFCLGNSLAHLLHNDDIHAALTNFSALVRPKGTLFLQILNYDRILEAQTRVQNVKEVGDTTYIRFYDFEKDLLRFNILKLVKKNGGIVHTLNSIPLRPFRQTELSALLAQSGFDDVSFFGGISLEPFDPKSSKDLMIVAKATV